MRTCKHNRLAAILAALSVSLPALSQNIEPVPDMSLEELLDTDVVSASRKTQNQQHVAAAVFVITQEDIARSGARDLPDVLAMAPGIEVARIGNNRWAVSARGFNGRFANKLQVLKDGRSIYSPLFSGVFWEGEDTVLEDIERIEIIRGPNAAMWGSNAVNGTINIITRKARDTQGGLVAVRTGTEDKASITARYGMALGDSGHMRIYTKGTERRGGYDADGNRAVDKSDSGLLGFRADWLPSSGTRVFVNGETFRNRNNDIYNFADPLVPGYINPVESTMTLSGSHLQGRFESLRDDGSEVTIQAYLTQRLLEADYILREERTTADLDIQYRLAPIGSHEILVGANYRNSRDTISNASKYVSFNSRHEDFQLSSIFINDEITVIPKLLQVTLGARLEYNNLTGSALQPTARFLWTPNPQQTIWGALSHATRTPSRAEESASMAMQVIPPSSPYLPFPTLVTFGQNPGTKPESEKMDAAELGYRHRFGQNLSLDTTAFIHRYRDGMSVVHGSTDLSHLPSYIEQYVVNLNGQRTRIYGLEMAMFAQLSPSWRLQPSYTWQHGTASAFGDPISEASAERDAKKIPRHLLSLRSQHNFGQTQRLDFWLKYKSRNEAFNIPERINLDARYAWRASRSTEISLVGQNLLHRHALEYNSDQLPSVPVEIGRSAYIRLEYRF